MADNWKHMFMQLVFVGNFIFLFSRVVHLPAFYHSFGFDTPDVWQLYLSAKLMPNLYVGWNWSGFIFIFVQYVC